MTAFGELNRREADLVRQSRLLPSHAPPRWLVVVSLAARGGLLWWVIAGILAIQPGRHRRAAARGALALVSTTLTSHLLGKAVVRRRRPRPEGVPARQALPESPRSSAFPSAHAASASAFAVAVATQDPLVGALIAPAALAVAYSRVRTRVHWPTDVLGGLALGIAAGLFTRLAFHCWSVTRRRS